MRCIDWFSFHLLISENGSRNSNNRNYQYFIVRVNIIIKEYSVLRLGWDNHSAPPCSISFHSLKVPHCKFFFVWGKCSNFDTYLLTYSWALQPSVGLSLTDEPPPYGPILGCRFHIFDSEGFQLSLDVILPSHSRSSSWSNFDMYFKISYYTNNFLIYL